MLRELLLADPQLLGVLGAVGSAMLAALAYFGKLRHERLRTTRVVLYYLLRLQTALSIANMASRAGPKHLVSAIAAAMSRHGASFSENERKELEQDLFSSAARYFSQQLDELAADVEARLSTALVELARDDPLLSLQLQMTPSISNAFPEKARPVQKASADFASTVKSGFRGAMMDEIGQPSRDSTIISLKKRIRLAAFHCGLFTLLNVEIFIRSVERAGPSVNMYPGLTVSLDVMLNEAVANELSRIQGKHGSGET